MTDLLKRGVSLYYFAFSLAGAALLLTMNSGGAVGNYIIALAAALVLIAVLSAPEWGALLAVVACLATPLVSSHWEEPTMALVAAAVSGYFLRRLFRDGTGSALRASDKLLFIVSAIVLVSSSAAALRYLSFQPIAGVLLPGIQINVWDYSADYVLKHILREGTFLFLIAPLVLMAAELRREISATKILKLVAAIAIALMVVFGFVSSMPFVPGLAGFSLFSGVGEWQPAVDLAVAYPLCGAGVGTYVAEAGNHSVSVGRPHRPDPDGPGIAGRMASELGFYITGMFIAALFLLQREIFKAGAPRAVTAWLLLAAGALIIFASIPFAREAVFLYLFLGGLMTAAPGDSAVVRSHTKLWLGFSIVTLLVLLPSLLLTNAALDPMRAWQRLRWPLEAGLYPEEGEGGYRWAGAEAIKSLTPDRHFLHVEWFAGNPKARSYRPTVRFYWDGRLVERSVAADSEKHHLFVPIDTESWLPRIFAVVTDPPFVPDEHLANGDSRELGIALVKLEFVDELPGECEGFWEWEGGEGDKFRWSGKEAFLRVPLNKPFRLRLRIRHPDAGEKPVRIQLDLNGGLEKEVTLSDREWRSVEIDPRGLPASALPAWDGSLLPEATGILRIRVSRTWVPADFGFSDDRRALGVAVGRIETVQQEE